MEKNAYDLHIVIKQTSFPYHITSNVNTIPTRRNLAVKYKNYSGCWHNFLVNTWLQYFHNWKKYNSAPGYKWAAYKEEFHEETIVLRTSLKPL
jgi:hypothetical protein